MKRFKAPWSTLLIVTSVIATLLCIAVVLGIGMPKIPVSVHGALGPVGWLLIALPLICALFTIRGYTILPDAILVHRLFWSTRLPRAGLQSATVDPEAIRWTTIRTCGNGGFFSITGLYWNKKIGSFRAFVTDPRRAVVLRFEGRKPVVISPDEPEEFVRVLTGAA